jgi:hypothetical protein
VIVVVARSRTLERRRVPPRPPACSTWACAPTASLAATDRPWVVHAHDAAVGAAVSVQAGDDDRVQAGAGLAEPERPGLLQQLVQALGVEPVGIRDRQLPGAG